MKCLGSMKFGKTHLCVVLVFVLVSTILNHSFAEVVSIDHFTNLNGWSGSNGYNSTITQYNSTTAKFTCSSPGYGMQQKTFTTYNVDTYPTLVLNVPQVGGGSSWALKVNNGGPDICLEGTSTATGVLSYNLKMLTGWSGTQKLNVRIFPIGGSGAYLLVDYIGVDTVQGTVLDEFRSADSWSPDYNAALSRYDSTSAKITCQNANYYGDVKRTFTYNVDTYPMISINTTAVGSGASWSLKVNSGGGDIVVQGENGCTGVSTFNLKSATGWTGTKTFSIKLYVVGGDTKYFVVDNISIGTAVTAPPSSNSLPKTPQATELTVFDLSKDLSLKNADAKNVYATLCAIQGLVNRTSTNKIYFTNSPNDWYWSPAVPENDPRRWPADLHWLNDGTIMPLPKTTPALNNSLTYPVLVYLMANYSGFISGKVMTPSFDSPASSDGAFAAAVTACGKLNAIPVAPNVNTYLLNLGFNPRKLADTTSLTSNKEAFDWAFADYFDSSTNRFVVGAFAQHGYGVTGYQALFPNMIDYFIANKVFVYALNCSDNEQAAKLPTLLNCKNYAYGTPVMGMLYSENIDASLVEDLGYSSDVWQSPNTTVTCSFPSNSSGITPQTPNIPSTFDKDGAYIGFVITDGDSAYFADGHHYQLMTQSANKGAVPVGWTMNVTMYDLFPTFLKWCSQNTFNNKYEYIADSWHSSISRNNGLNPFINRYASYRTKTNNLFRTANFSFFNPRITTDNQKTVTSGAGFTNLISGYGGGSSNLVIWSLFGTSNNIYTNMSGPTQQHATNITIVDAITKNIEKAPIGQPVFMNICIGDGHPTRDCLTYVKQAVDQLNASRPKERNLYYLRPSDVCAAWRKHNHGY